MALVGFTAQQCVRRPWSTSWRVSGWDDLGDYQQSGALSITTDETDAQPGGSTQATIIADGSALTINGAALPGWVSTVGTRNLVCLVLVGNTLHASANGETLARAMGLAGITGAGSVVLGEIASTAAGTVLSGRVGVASVTLGAVASTAVGSVGSAPVIGSASVTLGPVTSVATGTAANPAVPEILFGQPSGRSDGSGGPNFVLGNRITASVAGQITAAYALCSAAMIGLTVTVAVYANASATTPLATATATVTASGWMRVAFASPAIVAASTFVAAVVCSDPNLYTIKSGTWPTSNGAHLTFDSAWYANVPAITNPTAASLGATCTGVDVEFVPS
jgi:hypothetical protein